MIWNITEVFLLGNAHKSPGQENETTIEILQGLSANLDRNMHKNPALQMHDSSLADEINRKIPLWGLPLEASAFIIVTYHFGKKYPER